jgi:hypothetical protein
LVVTSSEASMVASRREEDVRILRLLKPRLPAYPVILDVGASNGRWTREIVKSFTVAKA